MPTPWFSKIVAPTGVAAVAALALELASCWTAEVVGLCSLLTWSFSDDSYDEKQSNLQVQKLVTEVSGTEMNLAFGNVQFSLIQPEVACVYPFDCLDS